MMTFFVVVWLCADEVVVLTYSLINLILQGDMMKKFGSYRSQNVNLH